MAACLAIGGPARDGKTALETMVCETSGYFVILTPAPEKFPYSSVASIKNDLRSGENT